MSPLGKIIGAVIGLLVGGIYGLFWGAVLGHFAIDETNVDEEIKRYYLKFKQFVYSKMNYRLRSFLQKQNINFLGKLIFSVIGIIFYGRVGFIWGIIIGHVLVDTQNNYVENIRKGFDEKWDEYWGKICLGVIGYILAGFPMALLGLIVGHQLDLRRKTSIEDNGDFFKSFFSKEDIFKKAAKSNEADKVALVQTMAGLSAKLAKVDGKVKKIEVEAFKRLFDIKQEDLKKIAQSFDQAKKTSYGFEEFAKQLKFLLQDDTKAKKEIIEALFQIAACDDEPNNKEINFIAKVARIIELPIYIYKNIEDNFCSFYEQEVYTQKSLKDAYKTLGLRESATKKEIKQKWHRLILENHPDTLMARGASKQDIELANKKMGAINAAYELIAKERNIK
jgi:DnaJ like chaperone protein